MPLITVQNQYQGINAHLHSYFQAEGDFMEFHNIHIVDLSRQIARKLPADYRVRSEKSLQIREYHPDSGERIRGPQPDLTVFTKQLGETGPTNTGGTAPTLTQNVEETLALDDLSYLSGLVVYEMSEGNPFGRAVLRIEILSRTNKRGGTGDIQYAEKRASTLQSGVRLVEVDYLHESHAMMNGLPRYPNDTASFSYHITVSDPLTMPNAKALTYGFCVDEPIPTITVSLLREDNLTIDFNEDYQFAFEANPSFGDLCDYEQPPANFDRYAPVDQERIRAVMARVQREYEDK